MSTTSDAHILVTIPNATLTSSSVGTFTGPLALEYVTFDVPSSATATTRDVLLVLRIGTGVNAFDAPLDPARALTVSTGTTTTAIHRYVFHATRDDSEFSVEFPATSETADDVELFHSVLVGYAADVHGDTEEAAAAAAVAGGAGAGARADEEEDLRGRFMLVNEDNGEIVGALDRSVRVHEDPSLGERGHEDDPVVVELPEGGDGLDELRDVEVIVRAIPPEDRDWMLKGAVFVRCVFSFLLLLYLSLTQKMFGILQSCHLGHYHSPHERDEHRLEHVHRALDTSILLHQRYRDPAALAHAPPPAIANDPETPDTDPHRQRQRRKAKQQSHRHRRAPDPARRLRQDHR